ncbi:MAG: amidohydrolase family protein [Planctomycetes bacterium]|nr:amidohydrolase family protein [Planctomycetota bacterium]
MLRLPLPAGLAFSLAFAAPGIAQDLTLRDARLPGSDRAVTIVVRGGAIAAIEDASGEPGAAALDVGGATVCPGLIDAHTHLLLRPYDQLRWDDQVLRESLELRVIRATVHATQTLEAGFTTIRELGTEGAGFADVALRDAIRDGIVPGPRILAATRALVATGCYGPAGFDPRWDVPKGAQVADGVTGLRIAVREQIAAGADWIKVYADYRRRPGDPATPTYSPEELTAVVAEARSAGLRVSAHAATSEGIRRAVLAGVASIEHGYEASDDVLALMRERGVVLCPTLAANEAVVRYAGANPVLARRLNVARVTFQRALRAGVTIACGSDAGVFAHGDNVRELELMVDYGMTPAQALAAATTTAAELLGLGDRVGRVAVGYDADLVVVAGNPQADITVLRRPLLVIRAGRIVVDHRAN